MQPANAPLVSTIKERCRMCYTCVRECPAKAIRIADQQAEVIPERCIGCGNCVRVCSQHAKRVASDLDYVYAMLQSGVRVAAIVAPSFPAEFHDIDYKVFVGMLRKLGFVLVNEVGFGADLVAAEYRHLMRWREDRRFIATSCPALVAYVERYHPDLVDSLAPVVSPMIATARALHQQHGKDLQIVFIGPCIAKKGEATSEPVLGDVNAVMTFIELAELFRMRGATPDSVEPSDFDPPHAGFGALFPISRGMLQAAGLEEDLLTGEVVVVHGHEEFDEAMKEFASYSPDVRLLECLCCNGCIMGPGLATQASLFERRARVSHYVRQRLATLDRTEWKRNLEHFGKCDVSRTYLPNDQRVAAPSEEEIRHILERMGKCKPEDELNCGACGYDTCREHAIAIYKGLAESEMCLPYTIVELRNAYDELTLSHKELASTQEALMQSEKLASMGQLAAGIAHEVNNPLGTVLMLSHILLDESTPDDAKREDLSLIVSEADRCKRIVSGLLHFARKNKVEARRIDLCDLIEQTANGLRRPEHIELRIEHTTQPIWAEIDRDQIVQVLTNLVSNALAAMPDGGTLTFSTGAKGDDVWFSVADTGVGISKENLKKIFEPFFTTKKAGEGTGLGLSVIYGVVKMHHGDIRVKSNADETKGSTGTVFTVSLPKKRSRMAAAALAS